MCPRLSWAFLVEDFPISFNKEIQPLATRFLKKWSGLARSANTSLLFLPRCSGGLGLPSLTLLYKKQEVSLQAQLQSSRDRAVRNVAQCQLQSQKGMIKQAFKPAVVVESVLEGNPCLRRKALVRVSRAVIASEEAEDLSASLSALPQQGRMMREFGGKEAAMWATAVGKLPPEPLKFALNATVESLPTNANLHKWGKCHSVSCPLCLGSCQSLFHILNNCPKAMFLRHYTIRHDNVLQNISRFIDCHLPPSYCMTVDL